MRILGLVYADYALRRATAERAPMLSSPDDGLGWNDELAAAWRAWRQAGEREPAAEAPPVTALPVRRAVGPRHSES